MTDVHEAAKAYYDRRRGQLLAVDVPELGCKVYYFKHLTAGDFLDLAPLVRISEAHALVETFYLVARDENGARLFTETNKEQLRKVWDYQIIKRTVEAMDLVTEIVGEEGENLGKPA